jgi:hypothetical protein
MKSYDVFKEWARLGIKDGNPLFTEEEQIAETEIPCPWRITHCNTRFDLCKTYPKYLVVPKSVSDTELKQVSMFRSGQRLMAMCWRDPRTNVTIWRSSQPKAGISGSNTRDEKFIDLLAKSVKDFQKNPTLHILDCRPKSSALANRAAGAGYESKSNYPNARLEFYNIGNIHVMRDSFTRLINVTNGKVGNEKGIDYGNTVEDTKWLGHVRLVLKASIECAQLVHNGTPVLVHCSHGWDRTSQVCALAELLLDPFYRTYQGFSVLVEKEWCSFGHPFQLRCAHSEDKSKRNDEQTSPIFLQFLDCVWQLLQQFPTMFEITPRYLLTIANHIHSCRFSTFCLSSEKDRELLQVDEKCTEIWTYLGANYDTLRNPFFEPDFDMIDPTPGTESIVKPVITSRNDRARHPFLCEDGSLLPTVLSVTSGVKLWSDFFERWAAVEVQKVAPSHFFDLLRDSNLSKGLVDGDEAAQRVVDEEEAIRTSMFSDNIADEDKEDKAEEITESINSKNKEFMADTEVSVMVTSDDFWEAAFRAEMAKRLELEAELSALKTKSVIGLVRGIAAAGEEGEGAN